MEGQDSSFPKLFVDEFARISMSDTQNLLVN